MNVFIETDENRHLIEEHKASAKAVEDAVAAAEAFEKHTGQRSPELSELIVQANRRHMAAHHAVMSAAKPLGSSAGGGGS